MGSDTPLTFKGIPLVWDKLTERELASSQPAAGTPRPSGARSAMGPPTGSDGVMEPGADSAATWVGHTIQVELRRRADAFERDKGGVVGPSLIVLLRDAATALDDLAF